MQTYWVRLFYRCGPCAYHLKSNANYLNRIFRKLLTHSINKHLFNTAITSEHTQPPYPLLLFSLSPSLSLTYSLTLILSFLSPTSITNFYHQHFYHHFQEPRNLLSVKNKATKNRQLGYSPGTYDPLVKKKKKKKEVSGLFSPLLPSCFPLLLSE